MTEENVRLTADLVAIAHANGEPHVLLIRRAHDPYEGHWALPGGHVDSGETAESAAIRELHEETGISVHEVEEIGVWHEPGRDPRGRYVTVAYRAEVPEAIPPTAADDAAEARWWPVGAILEMGLAFDHGRILIAACPHGVHPAVVDALTRGMRQAQEDHGDRG